MAVGVNATETEPPEQTAEGVGVTPVIVCANDDAATRSVAMQAKNPFLINVLFMYNDNIFPLTCLTGKVRYIFLIDF